MHHRNAARGGASGQEVEAGAAAGGATLQGASAQRTRARLREWANPNLNSTLVYRVLSRYLAAPGSYTSVTRVCRNRTHNRLVVFGVKPGLHFRWCSRYFRTSVLAPPLADTPNIEKLNGSSFGRPDMDLMFARWAFNKNVPHMALPTCRASADAYA